MTPTIRTATIADIPTCAKVLADAFATDPLMTALWPSADRRQRALPLYFAASLRHFHVPRGGVQLAADPNQTIGAVAVWDPPGQWEQTLTQTLRAVPDLWPALRSRTFAAIAVRRTLEQHHPHHPDHWYLANIGSSPSHRGRGYAAQLLANRLATPDTPAFLVCTRKETLPYYERHGFAVATEFTLPAGDKPTMWSMTRPPSSFTAQS